jgi:hypothetical protein
VFENVSWACFYLFPWEQVWVSFFCFCVFCFFFFFFDIISYRPFPSIIAKDELDKMWQWLCEDSGYPDGIVPPIAQSASQTSWDSYKKLEQLFFIPQCFKLVCSMRDGREEGI